MSRPDRASASEGLQKFPGCCGGVHDDILRRSEHWSRDYSVQLKQWSKTLSAALYMFFATLFSTIALGTLVQKTTHDRIGLSEYLLMNSVAGVMHSLIGGQPLLVLRPTGPITAIISKLSVLADTYDVPFHQLLASTGLGICFFMTLVAATELSRHVRRFTPFTLDIFACFVCSIYVHDGVRDVLGRFFAWDVHAHDDKQQDLRLREEAHFGHALFAALLGIATFATSYWLSGAPKWSILTPSLRGLLADYAVTIAVVLVTLLSFAPTDHQVEVTRIALPAHLSPTCYVDPSAADTGVATICTHATESSAAHAARRWLVNFTGVCPTSLSTASPPGQCWDLGVFLLGLLCAVPISFFFFMDQNISSLLCQRPELQLRHGHYYSSSFLAMGLFNGIGPLFGLPFVTGSLPHSPQFVRALTSTTPPLRRGGVPLVDVAEGRVAPILMYVGLGVPLLMPQTVGLLPDASIAGLLAFVGAEGILETQLFERLCLLLTDRAAYPPKYRGVPTLALVGFTGLQLLLLALCWVINLSPLGLCVAFLIVSLVPLREYGLPHVFSQRSLAILDGAGELRTAESMDPMEDPMDKEEEEEDEGDGEMTREMSSSHLVGLGDSASLTSTWGSDPRATW